MKERGEEGWRARLILITWQSKKCLLCVTADMRAASVAAVPSVIDCPSLRLPLMWGAPMDIALARPCVSPSPEPPEVDIAYRRSSYRFESNLSLGCPTGIKISFVF